ncbi:hypothetical protein EVAR_78837_1 [Eumeta japonica]|uniref:Uncharacterized protein n=1 Tax=Eumeta variegata TaxID=151549 RepID=A0A4C1ZE23_EUMVA|nr:hypothetical protein EVAR_78837_1 [Eumeta japonica]
MTTTPLVQPRQLHNSKLKACLNVPLARERIESSGIVPHILELSSHLDNDSHILVCFDPRAHSIDVIVVHSAGRAIYTKFVTERDTTTFEFCESVYRQKKPGEALLSC